MAGEAAAVAGGSGQRQASGIESFDAIVLGAGGAGLMCAATAGQGGARVLVVDHANEPGRKILISGGGRCNFTNTDVSPERFLSANPHFAKSALGRYTPAMFIDLVNRYGIAWHEKTLGQLFCDGSARQIVAMLMAECGLGHVTFAFGHAVTELGHEPGRFRVRIGSRRAQAPALVIATGGPAIPKLGATGYAYELARQFGLEVRAPWPALVPLTLGKEENVFRALSGVATPVVARVGRMAFREAALFTHKGLSGPAILQVSSYWQPGEAVTLDLVPDQTLPDWLVMMRRARPRASLHAALTSVLPARLAQSLADRLLAGMPMDQTGQTAQAYQGEAVLSALPDRQLRNMAAQLAQWSFHPDGTEGFAKAEVAGGGIATTGLSSKTLEAGSVPGLYAVGEAVDVTGWLGGYNFQWAWASGRAAGQAIVRSPLRTAHRA